MDSHQNLCFSIFLQNFRALSAAVLPARVLYQHRYAKLCVLIPILTNGTRVNLDLSTFSKNACVNASRTCPCPGPRRRHAISVEPSQFHTNTSHTTALPHQSAPNIPQPNSTRIMIARGFLDLPARRSQRDAGRRPVGVKDVNFHATAAAAATAVLHRLRLMLGFDTLGLVAKVPRFAT